MEVNIKVRDDMSEIFQYDFENYSACIKKGLLSCYPNYTGNPHWHDDVEFILIISGHMIYHVNGIKIRLEAGDGIFINSKQLHFGYSEDFTECEFICVLLHPMLLCTMESIESTFVNPIISDSSIVYIHLKSDSIWQNSILSSLKEMYDNRLKTSAPLIIQSLFYKIWAKIYDNELSKSKVNTPLNYHLTTFKNMLFFIQRCYKEKISLSDIANAGNVSKSSCTSLFKKYLNSTPVTYLINYRLKKSLNLLNNSELSITDIASECGFYSTSYYIETFKKSFGSSPNIYRKKAGHK